MIFRYTHYLVLTDLEENCIFNESAFVFWGVSVAFNLVLYRVGSRIFLGGGALVSCSTSTPINHIVFFLAEYQLY